MLVNYVMRIEDRAGRLIFASPEGKNYREDASTPTHLPVYLHRGCKKRATGIEPPQARVPTGLYWVGAIRGRSWPHPSGRYGSAGSSRWPIQAVRATGYR